MSAIVAHGGYWWKRGRSVVAGRGNDAEELQRRLPARIKPPATRAPVLHPVMRAVVRDPGMAAGRTGVLVVERAAAVAPVGEVRSGRGVQSLERVRSLVALAVNARIAEVVRYAEHCLVRAGGLAH